MVEMVCLTDNFQQLVSMNVRHLWFQCGLSFLCVCIVKE